jgi:H2-forming N5,N10-methylenetetrahydromethanopterin dehydrogenase-like enzyme
LIYTQEALNENLRVQYGEDIFFHAPDPAGVPSTQAKQKFIIKNKNYGEDLFCHAADPASFPGTKAKTKI